MSVEEEVTRLEFVSKATNQTYTADRIIIVLSTEGYNIDPKIGNVEDRRNTILSISINSNKESIEDDHNIKSPYQLLRLNFQYHYSTPFQDHDNWIYDLTQKELSLQRKARRLGPDFFRVIQDDQWVIAEWLSYTRKETYGGTSTTDSPDGLRASLAIPASRILSLQTIKEYRY